MEAIARSCRGFKGFDDGRLWIYSVKQQFVLHSMSWSVQLVLLRGSTFSGTYLLPFVADTCLFMGRWRKSETNPLDTGSESFAGLVPVAYLHWLFIVDSRINGVRVIVASELPGNPGDCLV